MKFVSAFDVWYGKEQQRGFFLRESRWIKIREEYNVTKRHSLYDYCTDENGNRPYQQSFNPENGTYLYYFVWQGRKYALDQFIRIGSIADAIGHHIGYYENGNKYYLAGYDENNLYSPAYIELDEYCEHVRIYTN